MSTEKLSLGGKVYYHAGIGPIRQDLFLMMHARHAGLTGVSILPDETPEAFAQRILSAMISSGRALLILGTLLIPEGKKVEDWSEDLAYETAKDLGAIMDPDEKQRVYQQLLSAVLGFFENGLGSWVASTSSSRADAGAKKTEETRNSSPAGPGGTGPDSSASSETTIPSDASASSAGT